MRISRTASLITSLALVGALAVGTIAFAGEDTQGTVTQALEGTVKSLASIAAMLSDSSELFELARADKDEATLQEISRETLRLNRRSNLPE